MGRPQQPQDEQKDTQYTGLKLLKDCPVCDTVFQSADIRIVDTYENVHLLHLTCSGCAHALLSLFAVSHVGMSSVGMATDLSAIDADRLLDTAPIGEDEVLSFHALLRGMAQSQKSFEDFLLTRV